MEPLLSEADKKSRFSTLVNAVLGKKLDEPGFQALLSKVALVIKAVLPLKGLPGGPLTSLKGARPQS